jgi:hypothetical protein
MKFIHSLLVALVLIPTVAFAQAAPVQQSPQDLQAPVFAVTATAAGNAAATATISAVVGSCLYITDIYIVQAANAAVTAAAGPQPVFTSAGLPTNLIWWGDNGTYTTGQMKVVVDSHFVHPIKVPQSTAFTIASGTGGQSTYNDRIHILAYAAGC